MYASMKSSSDCNPFAIHWAPAVFTDTTLFYSILFGFSKCRELLLGYCLDEKEQLQYLKFAFNNFRLKLSNGVDESKDLLILCALTLTLSETLQPDESLPAKFAWRPPWHTLYARTTNSNPHIRAAFELVKLKGGIENIELWGLKPLLV